MNLEGVEETVQAAKKLPECLNSFCLTTEMIEPPWTCKFEVRGETKYCEEKHINDAEYSLNEG